LAHTLFTHLVSSDRELAPLIVPISPQLTPILKKRQKYLPKRRQSVLSLQDAKLRVGLKSF